MIIAYEKICFFTNKKLLCMTYTTYTQKIVVYDNNITRNGMAKLGILWDNVPAPMDGSTMLFEGELD